VEQTLKRLAALPATPCVLAHTDLNPSNIMVDAKSLEIAAVLDWERARVGIEVGICCDLTFLPLRCSNGVCALLSAC
jgi:aminoglycoside phosphotransferase (APT) family kinase protein